MNVSNLKKWPLISLITVIILAFLVYRFFFSSSSSQSSYRTVPVTRGNLLVAISATGTVQPEEVIDIGAQVAGKIESFGIDKNGKSIDYSSEVEEGTVLATIDDTLFRADLFEKEAQLKRAEASLMQAQAKFGQAQRDWQRAQKLGPSTALSQSNYDAFQAALELAKADIAVAESEIAVANANLQKAQQNLGYCTIKAPVKGVIIDRRVNIGQTVVSSLNAPSLFLIAKDLRQMQVWVSVNEADIGNISPGQKATFTVDTFPGEIFNGNVGKIRLNASMNQNVVTYIVEILTDNSNNKLLPYLTASVKFFVNQFNNVLLVPNSALRWRPLQNLTDQSSPVENDISTAKENNVWILSKGTPVPIKVKILGTDGVLTAVETSEFSEGAAIIIRQIFGDDGEENEVKKNPFTPKLRQSKPKQ